MPGRLNARQRGRSAAGLSSGPHLLHHRPSAEDRHDASEVVRKHMEAHLGADMLTCLHQEVRRAHPEFQRTEWVFNGLTAYAHHVRLLVEALLHRLDDGLMFPALYPASLFARCALFPDCTGKTG